MLTTYQEADRAIAAYDAFIFACVGRPFDAALVDRADTLAAVVVCDCEEAAQDRTATQWMRDYYRARVIEFRAICA